MVLILITIRQKLKSSQLYFNHFYPNFNALAMNNGSKHGEEVF